jgi:transposase
VKPICPFQQVFKSTYLFGAFSPLNGDKFLLELPNCNAQTFQIYLDEFSLQNQAEFKIIVLDNGAFHKALTLEIPENIALIFLPPYSPELNPAEKVWAVIKRKFTNTLHKSLEELSDFIASATKELTASKIKTITNYEYISAELNWTI